MIIYSKVKRSNRYDYVSYSNSFKDHLDKQCSVLYYTDSFQSGIQIELFYNFQLNDFRVNSQIDSMNKAWIDNKIEFQPKYKGYKKDSISLNKKD